MSWDALLRTAKRNKDLELELLTLVDKHLFIERGMQGGISMVSKRYAKASNPLLLDYDASKTRKCIAYLNANNLYGWAMSNPLPKKGSICKRVLLKEEDILKKKEKDKKRLGP